MDNFIRRDNYIWFDKDKPPITEGIYAKLKKSYSIRPNLEDISKETGIPVIDLSIILKDHIEYTALKKKEKELKEQVEREKNRIHNKRRKWLGPDETEFVKRVYAEKSIPIRILSKILGINHTNFEYFLWKIGIWRREKRRFYTKKQDPPKHWAKWQQKEYKAYYDRLIEIKEQNDKLQEDLNKEKK